MNMYGHILYIIIYIKLKNVKQCNKTSYISANVSLKKRSIITNLFP